MAAQPAVLHRHYRASLWLAGIAALGVGATGLSQETQAMFLASTPLSVEQDIDRLVALARHPAKSGVLVTGKTRAHVADEDPQVREHPRRGGDNRRNWPASGGNIRSTSPARMRARARAAAGTRWRSSANVKKRAREGSGGCSIPQLLPRFRKGGNFTA